MVTSVLGQERSLNFRQEENQTRFEIRTSEPVVVRISRRVAQANHIPDAMYGHQVKVALRRGLSELRDRMMASGDRALTLMRPLLRNKAQAVGDKKDR